MTVEQTRTLLRWKKSAEQIQHTANKMLREKKLTAAMQSAMQAFAKAAGDLSTGIELFVNEITQEEID